MNAWPPTFRETRGIHPETLKAPDTLQFENATQVRSALMGLGKVAG